MTGRDPAAHELRDAAMAGVRWVVVARVVAELLLLGSTIVLARLLKPSAFGHAAIALIFTALAGTLIAGVAGPLLIQRADLTDAHCQASVFLGLVLGAVFTLAVCLLAPVAAAPVFGRETADLIQLASAGFILTGLAAAPQALLARRLRFRRLSEIEIAAAVLGTGASIGFALAGFGARSIVLGALFGIGLSSAGALASIQVIWPRWHRTELTEVARFGSLASLSALAALTYSNMDYAILGARLNAAVLGLYWRAYQLGAEYQGKISIVMLRLAFPVYSRSADREHLKRVRRRIVRVHATVIFPLLGILIVTAPELIPFLYGSAWRGAVLPTQILAAVGMMAAVLTGIGQLMYAIGELRRMAVLSWISVLVYGTTIYFVAPYGITAVCIADACLYFCLLMSSHYFLASKQAGIPLRSLWEEVSPALVGTAVLLAVCGLVASFLRGAGVAAPVNIAFVAAVGLSVYSLVIRRFSNSAWADVRLLGTKVRRHRRPSAPRPEISTA